MEYNISFTKNLFNFSPCVEEGKVTIHSSTNEKIICLGKRFEKTEDVPLSLHEHYVKIKSEKGDNLYVESKALVEKILQQGQKFETMSALMSLIEEESKVDFLNQVKESFIAEPAVLEKALNEFLSSWPEIISSVKSEQELLEKIGVLIDLSESPVMGNLPHFFSHYAEVCDEVSKILLSQKLPSPLVIDRQTLVEQAVSLRAAASNIFIGQESLGIQFSQEKIPNLVLIGKKIDPGIHYQNIGNSHVADHQIQITKRAVKGLEKSEYTPTTELRFTLTPLARKEMEVFIKTLTHPKENSPLITNIEQRFGHLTVTPEHLTHFEISEAKPESEGFPEFKESETVFGKMLRIELDSVGEILIGNEEMSETPDKEVLGRFIPHHTVVVRLYNDRLEIDDAQLKSMHKLLSLVGLSGTLIPTPDHVAQKSKIMDIVRMYVPDLIVPIQMSKQFQTCSPEQLKTEVIELLQTSVDTATGITALQMKDIFQKELSGGGIKRERCVLGSGVSKLSTVSEEMRKVGAYGFFAGISGGAGVVASVLKSGFLTSGDKGLAGFAFPPTCLQDAVTGGNGCVFLRLATQGTLESEEFKLADCPYINMFQAIVSLDAANLPHSQMRHNSYGLQNPMTELTARNDQEAISGTTLLSSSNPIQFTKDQNQSPTVDNEVPIRTKALDASYITKITYQDPRKALLNYLQTFNDFPEPLLESLSTNINQEEGSVSLDLQKEIKDFLEKKGLIEHKPKDKGGEELFVLNFSKESQKIFGNNLDTLFQNPRWALKQEIIKNKLIDSNGNFLDKNFLDRGISFNDFLIETNQLTKELF